MAFLTVSILILVQYFSWTKEISASANELLHQYETLQPFHENMAIIMPEEKCKNTGRSHKAQKDCWIDIKWEDHTEPLEKLLLDTENSLDTSNPDFIHTPLGQQYQHLKKLMNLHKSLKSCSADDSVVNDDILYRIQSNTASALENQDMCRPVSSNAENSIALFGSHLEQINNNRAKESSFEDDLFSEALKTSIQTRINFTRQTGNNNINTQKFKQTLLDKYCTGNISTSTSRGIKNRKGWICSKKDEEIIKNLIREAINSANTKKLVQQPTKLSHQEEICFTTQRKKKCTNTNIYEFQTTPPKFAKEDQMDFLPTPIIVADINERIANLNLILEDYNDQRKELEEKWALENPRQEKYSNLPEKRKTEHEHSLKLKKFNDELKRLKKTFFLEYKQELALLHTSGAGALLQTDAIRNKSNFKDIEKITSKGLGLFGFEEAELTHKEDFPLLQPIDDHTAHLAVQERFQRMDQYIENLLSDQRNKHKVDQQYLKHLQENSSEDLEKWYNDQRFERLSKLILFNPQILSSILINKPEYSSILCMTTVRIAKDQKFKDMLKSGIFIGAAVGATTIALLTAGAGAPASFTSALSMTAGIGIVATDFTLRLSEVNRHSRNQEDLLNAYLSQTGDHQSIEDIRKEWKLKIKEQFQTGWALALGTFTIFKIRSSIQKGVFTKKENPTPTLQVQNDQLPRIITENNQYIKPIQDLLQKYPLRSVQRLLRSTRRLPPDQQRTVLDSFSKITKHDSFNLTAFTREIKKSASKDSMSKILQRWAVCFSCRVKAGTRKQKDSADDKSIIESSQL